jgi:tetratricopeptide (TPR) repeat protein
LLHRDVKPGHVILSDGASGMPVAKLIDAGLPGRLPSGSVFDLLGTPAYISPEQVAGKLVSFRSDLYALGCVLFEMLSGLPPFPDSDVQAVLDAHKSTPAPSLDIELPAQVQTLLRAMLAKEPRQRPFSAQQVRRTLEPLLPAGAELPALGARPLAGATVRSAAGNIPAVTEEIELEELEVGDQPAGPKTLSLSADDIEEIDPSNPGPRTLSLSADDIEALEVREEAGNAQAEEAVEPDAGVLEAIEHEPEPVAAPVIAPPEPEPAAPPAAAAEAPSRRAVSFDVESLFDDDVPAERAREHESLHDAAPTQLYRMPEAAQPPAEKPKPASVPAPATRERQGTVVSQRPQAKKPLPLIAIAAAIGVAVLLIAFALRGRSASTASQPAAQTAASATAAATEPNAAAAPTVQPVEQAHAANDQAPQAAAPAHAGEEVVPVRPAAEPAANDTASAKDTQANTQPNQGAATAQPAAAAGTTNDPNAAAANPTTQGDVVPANVAAAKTNATDLNRTAELTAANQAGRSQPASASAKLTAAQGARSDRLAKADELKAQGRTAFSEGRYKDAAAAYEKATEQNPSDAGAFAGLAASKLQLNDGNAAIAAYSRAVRLQPASSGFHAALGRAYLQQNDRARARAAYEHALQLDPNNAAAKTALAQLK